MKMTPDTFPRYFKALGRAARQVKIIQLEEALEMAEQAVDRVTKDFGEERTRNAKNKLEAIRKALHGKIKDLAP